MQIKTTWSLIPFISCLIFPATPVCFAEDTVRGILMESISDTQLGQGMEEMGISLSGWLQGSYTASSSDGDQLPLGFNYLADEFQLQQSWIKFERKADEDIPISIGADWILPGTDYRFTLAQGIYNEQLSDGRDNEPSKYGYDPVQFFVGLENQKIMDMPVRVKLGRFASPYGVESMEAVNTPLVSRSYTFIYNPFTHMGALSEIQINETISGKFGIVSGSDAWIEQNPKATFLTGLDAEWADHKLSALAILSDAKFEPNPNTSHPNIIDIVYSNNLTTSTEYKLELLYGWQREVPAVGTASWFGIVQYLSHKISDELNATGRLELFNDFDGNRTGYRGLYRTLSAALTYNYKPWLRVTPELRGDYVGSSRPFDGNHYVLTAALGLILLW